MKFLMKAKDCDKTKITQEIDRPKHYASKSGKDIIDWCKDFGLMSNAYIQHLQISSSCFKEAWQQRALRRAESKSVS